MNWTRYISGIAIIVTFVVCTCLVWNACNVETGEDSDYDAGDQYFPEEHTLGKPVQSLPDLYPLSGTGTLITTSDPPREDLIYISCDNGNKGTAKWYSVDSLNKGFIELKILNLDNGFFWEYYKDHYEPSPKCIDIANCDTIQEYNTLGVGEHDIYTDSLHVKDGGTYIGSETINDAGAYQELSRKNNTIYFGFRLAWTGGNWIQAMDSTILTQRNINKLNRMK